MTADDARRFIDPIILAASNGDARARAWLASRLDGETFASQVTRVLLMTPRRKWRQRDRLADLLAAIARTDPKAVGRVLGVLHDAARAQ